MLIRTPSDLGAAIKDRRRQRGLNQAQLADEIGTSRQWLIDVEKGRPGAEIGLVFRALNALGLEISIAQDSIKAKGRRGTHIDIDAIVAGARKAPK